MNFFAVTGYVLFTLTFVQIWLEKFLVHNLSGTSNYLFRKLLNLTHTSNFDQCQAYKTYTNGVLFFIGSFGFNAILHSLELRIIPLTFVIYTLNILCFFLHCGYSLCLPFHIIQDYTGLRLVYNFIMWLYLSYVYFFTPSYTMYFNYFVIITIPHIVRASLELYNYHYYGDNIIFKVVDMYLNYF